MTWRTVMIEKGGKLALQDNQLKISQQNHHFTVPIEDIAIIIVESVETVITTPLLTRLAQENVSLMTCDESHLPCGQWLPLGQYHRPLQTLKLQLNASQPLKKQLWARIVKQKIHNQGVVLEKLGLLKSANKLYALEKDVKSGDRTNKEAQSASLYFTEAFGKTFCRREENSINAHLNYAYAILRSAVARSLVQYGWLPHLGLHHCNEQNPFNLADDFIEPFRPLVDWKVWQLWQTGELTQHLTPDTKRQLVKLLNYEMTFQGERYALLASIDRTCGSLKRALQEQQAEYLRLPELTTLREHCYE